MSLALLEDVEFKAGVRIGGLAGGSLVVALYTLGATTHDIRARIPFLLVGLSTLLPMVTGILLLAGILAVWSIRGVSLRGAIGAALSAVTLAILLVINAPARVIPDLENPTHGIAAFLAAAGVVVGLGWWERVKAQRERRENRRGPEVRG